MKRREFLAAVAAALSSPRVLAQNAVLVEVWRSPTCGCCGAWVKHLQRNGFATKVHMVDDTAPVRRAAGMPEKLGGCHTAKVSGYVIEGHVPASDIKRLLAEKPQALGLTAPGMPAGSPGMDIPNSPPYEVLLVTRDGKTSVFHKHG
jgi:hypothetical protein